MKRYSKILLCAVLTTALLLSFVVPSSAKGYKFDVFRMFGQGLTRVDIEQYGSQGVIWKSFALTNYQEKSYYNKTFFQSMVPAWREIGGGYDAWGSSYALLKLELDVSDLVWEELNHGRLESLDLYFYYYIESGQNGVKYPNNGVTFQLDNREYGGSYLDISPEIVGEYVTDDLGISQNLYKISMNFTEDFEITPSTDVKFLMSYSGKPSIGAYLTFGMSADSSIGIKSSYQIQEDQVNQNNGVLNGLENQIGGIVEDLDTPKPEDDSVNEALDGIDVGSAQSLGSLIGFHGQSNGGFYRFVLTVCLSSLGVAFIGYVLHGKRG